MQLRMSCGYSIFSLILAKGEFEQINKNGPITRQIQEWWSRVFGWRLWAWGLSTLISTITWLSYGKTSAEFQLIWKPVAEGAGAVEETSENFFEKVQFYCQLKFFSLYHRVYRRALNDKFNTLNVRAAWTMSSGGGGGSSNPCRWLVGWAATCWFWWDMTWRDKSFSWKINGGGGGKSDGVGWEELGWDSGTRGSV